MKFLKINPKKNRAQAMVEFAIVLPILLLVVYGLIETGRLIFVVASVNNATRQAVRYGSTSGVGDNGVPRYKDCVGIRAAAEKSDFLNAFQDSNIAISYDDGVSPSPTPLGNCNGSSYSGATLETDDRVKVAIDANFNAIFPGFLPFLSRTITAESSRTLLLTINIEPPKETTTITINSHDPNPSEPGDQVLVTFSVSSTTPPTGDVQISGAETNCSVTLAESDNGSGSCLVTFTVAGIRSIVATYVGDAGHEGSSTSVSHQVDKELPVVTITSDTPDPSLVTDTVTVTFTVTGTHGTPTGDVTITGQNQGCLSPVTLVNGAGSCTLTFTSNGKKTITASYGGDTQYKTASDTERHDVIQPTETVTIIQSHAPDPSEVGQSVTVVVSVGGITPPSGTVDITGADTNCSFTLPSTSCVVTFNSIGVKTITATFTSSNPAQTGSSDSVSHTVQLPATTTTITSHTPSPSEIGKNVTVTVTVTGGSTTPTGTVVIGGADTTCTITLAGGTGSCDVVFNSSGSKALTAAYSGDSLHAASNDTETHVVSMPPIDNCDTVTYSLLKQTNGALTMDINNPTGVPLQIGDVTVTWNHDKGHQTGDDKTLRLQFVNLNGSTFWSGDNSGPTLTPIVPNPPTYLPTGPSTISFIFHQTFDRWDDTERVIINLSTPGCNTPLDQNQH